MSCGFGSVLTINDGTKVFEIHDHASLRGSIGQVDPQDGQGVTVYADGSARRWIRFQGRTWTFTFSGPAPSQLWEIDLSADTWTATFEDPENIGNQLNVAVVPARPSQSNKDMNSAERAWTLQLREASAR
jgi:hypothetical protein